MAGYRRVNYYELCRLCTSSEGTKMHIFRAEGRRRSLPSKIQTCLPLQVQEEDSLPKIICGNCVEKLETFFEFRQACINAEAMLESYFTSLRYSDDLTREGKVSVYVKDEPITNKDDPTKSKISVPNLKNISTTKDENTILPTTIQILTDPDGSRLTQFKVQVQNGLPSFIPYGEQSSLPYTIASQTVKPQTTSAPNSSRAIDSTQTANGSASMAAPPLVAAVTLVPQSQDLLQQIGLTAKDRNSLTEVLKLKNINILDPGSCESVGISSSQVQANQISTQVSNLIPTQIRLDPNQLTQIINSNLQINMSQLQSNQRESAQQSKVGFRNILPANHNAVSDTKGQEEKESRERNGSNDSLNNSIGEKPNMGINDIPKQNEDENLKFPDVTDEGLDPNDIDDVVDITEDNHQNTNTEGNMFVCKTCDKAFKKKEHLFQHLKSHTGERPYKCATCSKAFSRKEHLLRHNMSHTGQKLYSCDVCHKSFSRKDNLHKHKRTHGINGPYSCETCGKSFVVKRYYMTHRAQHEKFPETEKLKGTAVKHLLSTESMMYPLPFKCELCPKSFSLKSHLTSHQMRHRNRIKTDSGEQQQQQQIPQQEQQSSSEITIPQPTILTGFSASTGNLNLSTLSTQLTTINPNALLAPNLIQHSNANVVQIGNNSYLCTPNVTSELLEQYRRMHNS